MRMKTINIYEEASRCMLCLDAPCTKACKTGDPARAIRAIRFDNHKPALRWVKDCTDADLERAELACVHYNWPIRIKEIIHNIHPDDVSSLWYVKAAHGKYAKRGFFIIFYFCRFIILLIYSTPVTCGDIIRLEHIKTGKPICYTSADSVFQIAAHEEYFGLDRLYKLCEIAFKYVAPYKIARVIARPFVGEKNKMTRRDGIPFVFIYIFYMISIVMFR